MLGGGLGPLLFHLLGAGEMELHVLTGEAGVLGLDRLGDRQVPRLDHVAADVLQGEAVPVGEVAVHQVDVTGRGPRGVVMRRQICGQRLGERHGRGSLLARVDTGAEIAEQLTGPLAGLGLGDDADLAQRLQDALAVQLAFGDVGLHIALGRDQHAETGLRGVPVDRCLPLGLRLAIWRSVSLSKGTADGSPINGQLTTALALVVLESPRVRCSEP